MLRTDTVRPRPLWVSYGFGLLALYAVAVSGCSDRQPFECGVLSPKVTADGGEVLYQQLLCEGTGILSSRVVSGQLLAYDVERRLTSRLSSSTVSRFDCSGDAMVIVYQADQTTLAIHDRAGRRTSTVDVAGLGRAFLVPSIPVVSGDGRIVAFTILLHDNDEAIFVYDRVTEELERATTVARAIRPSLSDDGWFLAFQTDPDPTGSGIPAVYVLNRDTQETALVSVNNAGEPADNASFEPVISGDGRSIAFRSAAANLVASSSPGSAEVYLHDLSTSETMLVSRTPDGKPSGTRGWLGWPSLALSTDGQLIAYESDSNTVVATPEGTVAPTYNIYLYDRRSSLSTRVSISTSGQPANRFSTGPSISGDGRFVAFVTNSDNLVPNDTDLDDDIYLRNVWSGVTQLLSGG